MRLELLTSSFGSEGAPSQLQHLSCIVIDDVVAFDAGSLAFSCSDRQRDQIRDVIISHSHLDHIAGLPLFLDDLFSTLTEPVRVHAKAEVIEVLERDVFNWSIYPKFSELSNANGPVLEYRPFLAGNPFNIKHLRFTPIDVNHMVSSVGAIISDGRVSVGITGDTAHTEAIWKEFNNCEDLAAVLVECAFPDDLTDLAAVSHHLTPTGLASELAEFTRPGVPVYAINLKPMYRDQIVEQIEKLAIDRLHVLEIGRPYDL